MPNRLNIVAIAILSLGAFLASLALYHDIGASIDNPRQADILFFGNSRMQLGLREQVIVPAARALGLRAFALATGHADRTRLALEPVQRRLLRAPQDAALLSGAETENPAGDRAKG